MTSLSSSVKHEEKYNQWIVYKQWDICMNTAIKNNDLPAIKHFMGKIQNSIRSHIQTAVEEGSDLHIIEYLISVMTRQYKKKIMTKKEPGYEAIIALFKSDPKLAEDIHFKDFFLYCLQHCVLTTAHKHIIDYFCGRGMNHLHREKYYKPEFNRDIVYYKILNEKWLHHGHQYVLGENKDKIAFCPSGSCLPGGLYFTEKEYVYKFLIYGCDLAEIEIPKDALVYPDPDGYKYKADKFIIKSVKKIDADVMNTILTWKYKGQFVEKYGSAFHPDIMNAFITWKKRLY